MSLINRYNEHSQTHTYMKKIISCLVAITMLLACNQTPKDTAVATVATPQVVETATTTAALPPMHDAVLENAVIYEANIRQYSTEGTFSAFTKDIPSLKQLGVKILWLMPIYPISTTKSKGSLGSYYAVSDYTKVNPEFGTIEDFRTLLRTAHEHGIYVVLDWVANHTGWDHTWIQEHPEYYTQNAKGEIVHTEGTDWTDVADLNYDNPQLRAEMLAAMKYWVAQEGIDGFRCDVAGMVPVDFWEHTVTALQKIKPLFMLAEGWEPELQQQAFDMGYAWDTHHVMNSIAQGKKDATAWDQQMHKNDSLYAQDDILMNFTSNHDENSWNGTVTERMGAAKELFAALSYTAPGMPLIYSGQEYDMEKRLLFFEKDTIPKQKGTFYPLYQQLGTLKNTHPALHGGKQAASYTRIKTSNDTAILAFTRAKAGKALTFVANMTDQPVTFTMDYTATATEYLSGTAKQLTLGQQYNLKPWGYWILDEL